MASAQAWSIKKRWASKFEEFLRTSSAGHLAVSLIRGDCVYNFDLNYNVYLQMMKYSVSFLVLHILHAVYESWSMRAVCVFDVVMKMCLKICGWVSFCFPFGRLFWLHGLLLNMGGKSDSTKTRWSTIYAVTGSVLLHISLKVIFNFS